MLNLKSLLVAGFVLAAQNVAGHAVVVNQPFTVTFGSQAGNFLGYVEDGMTVDVGQLTNGNCAVPSCLLLNPGKGRNPGDISTLSRVGGGQFTLVSFWLQTLGVPSQLTVKALLNSVLQNTTVINVPKNNGGQVISYLFGGNYDAITFEDSGKGNIRIDDIKGSYDVKVNAVPVPAGLPLLVTGLLALGAMRRRAKR